MENARQRTGSANGLNSGWCHGCPGCLDSMRALSSSTFAAPFVRSPGLPACGGVCCGGGADMLACSGGSTCRPTVPDEVVLSVDAFRQEQVRRQVLADSDCPTGCARSIALETLVLESVIDFVIHHPSGALTVQVGYLLAMANEMLSSILVHINTDYGSESCIQRVAEAPHVRIRTSPPAMAPLDPLPHLPCDRCALRHAPRQIELCSAIRMKLYSQ